MFVKPKRSKAIPIVKPPEEDKEVKAEEKRPSSAKSRPLVQEIAIQQAANAIASLKITSKSKETVPTTVTELNGKSNNTEVGRMVKTEPQKRSLTPTDDDDQDYEPGFDIYARPFIPEIFTVINTLPGQQVVTGPNKTIDFDDYISRSLGPAAGFLPQTSPICLPSTASSFTEASSISPKYYEEFFHFHLSQEIQAQRMENETYSCKQH